MTEPWSKAGREPAIWDVLADPIVQSLMRADRVTRGEVLNASQRASDRVRGTSDLRQPLDA